MSTFQVDIHQALEGYREKKIILDIVKEVRSGKEATVYLVSNQKHELFALKVYKNPDQRAFKHTEQYLAGKYFRSASLRRAVTKKNTYGRKVLNDLWTKREFYLLKLAFNAGVHVPKPFEWTSNSILMEFVGSDEVPAPRLSDVDLDSNKVNELYLMLMKDIEILRDRGIVHGDFSEYNVLIADGRPYIIDFPQALDIRNNPNWEEMYKRDIANIKKYFQKL